MPKYRFNVKHWKNFTSEHLDIIEKERKERKENPIQIKPGKEYSKVCPACTKPNQLNQSYCTGCSFVICDEDVVQMPDNVFKDILEGKIDGTEILFRSSEVALWEDKFGVSVDGHHLDVVSIEEIVDVTELDQSHVSLLEKMFQAGLKEFESRNIPYLLKDVALADQIVAGYNHPVSVPHLHLHLVLAPFKHEKVFQYPRWHSHRKVVSDLKEFNRVRLYSEHPNDEEGEQEYKRAMDLHCKLSDQKKKTQS